MNQRVNSLPIVDRISHLPEAVLLHILSFLSTKVSIQTCVLSKRWRYLWTSIPTLDLDDDLFPTPTSKKRKLVMVKNTNFINFVDKVLILRDGSDLYKLCLSYDACETNAWDGCTWIRYAIKHNVQELDLNVYNEGGCFEFPTCFFTSNSLVALKLNFHDSRLKLPRIIGFGSLKTLDLLGVIFQNRELNFELFPLLEYLTIKECVLNDLKISAPKLKSLIIEDCCRWVKFKLSAPNLLSFKYIGSIRNECDLENLSSLANAFIEITDLRIEVEGVVVFSKILQAVLKAEVLELCWESIMLLSREPTILESLPPATSNLKCLKLTASLGYLSDVQVIIRCLKTYVNTETLVIDNTIDGPETEYYLPTTCDYRYQPFDCQLDHLKEVEIRNLQGYGCELEFVKFLLAKAKVLEKMIISTCTGGLSISKKRMLFNKKLLTFPRASSNIAIFFS